MDYTYNLDGLRTNKTVDGVAHNYLYAGGKLMRETYGSNTLDFFYDANGIPYALKYNGAVYYYITNLQGDVTYLVDANGTAAATYEYDPYGNIITATGTLAQINPLRYRGYYYDNETGLYYLQSRYYDPAVGRLINADSYTNTDRGLTGFNMFAYCNNCPTNYYDDGGEIPQAIEDKMIHNCVLEHICGLKQYYPNLTWHQTCVYYNGKNWKGGFGFCDLYNKSTGEVWELKKDSTSRSCTTIAAQAQLLGYTKGKLKHHPNLSLVFPKSEIPAGSFTFTSFGYIYDVKYWDEHNGVLRYSYTRQETERSALATAVVTVASIIALLFAPELAPGITIPAFA